MTLLARERHIKDHLTPPSAGNHHLTVQRILLYDVTMRWCDGWVQAQHNLVESNLLLFDMMDESWFVKS